MHEFKSKISLGISLFLCLVLGGVSVIMVITHAWPGLIIVACVALIIICGFLSLSYTIEDRTLVIKGAIMKKICISIDEITQISETNNPLSAPAASLDRIKIVYGKHLSVMISPRNKRAFIHYLKSINPDIEVRLKTK
jgi:hypothetical protein